MSSRDLIVAEIPRLRRYARALTGDAARADDLVQDTLERALSRFSLWRPGNLRAWLFTIMHNIFVNQIKSAANIDYLADELLPDLPLRATQSDNLELRDLDRALSRLSAEQREVLLLVGLEDLSYEEAARIVGTPIGTVMSRLSRGRERLRALLSGVELAAAPQLKVIK
ncbi:MAG TPA: sigma-70 family RNA polymerase sigma factor [Rhodocyclaceae bacterium]|nr:sigma-70 family RNA polymerase sigma factor [Rhodocyclaceae bacterium]HMV52334.1 sigma-70 family RNA polymerase sigma factor [Rhodocyclaceae bacterium]HNB78094.1 sigma-70 family RNA polymerase sigma factor [Rhodocyclaceae bacterium]HNC60545.1 sigma-70 family RNA polymerase sigma factor [Rhodocyclaceae bacterium]HNH13633.1 sigma-70 family RNA polymerase sigma factor [Rhodocyclaceae bacterium]